MPDPTSVAMQGKQHTQQNHLQVHDCIMLPSNQYKHREHSCHWMPFKTAPVLLNTCQHCLLHMLACTYVLVVSTHTTQHLYTKHKRPLHGIYVPPPPHIGLQGRVPQRFQKGLPAMGETGARERYVLPGGDNLPSASMWAHMPACALLCSSCPPLLERNGLQPTGMSPL